MNRESWKAFLQRNIGIAWSLLFYGCFYVIARAAGPYLNAAQWYLFSSVQRIIFGVAALAVFVKLFRKESWRSVIHFTHFKAGILAGIGVLVYTLLVAVSNAAAFVSLKNTAFATLFFCLICQQVTTGFWEELNFRALVLEGYFCREKTSRWHRLAYAGISFLIFGLVHAVEYDNLGDAAYIFMLTGMFGFIFASVYLYSHNILAPMLLHFVYDIAANFQQFVEVWDLENRVYHALNYYVIPAAFAAMFIAAVFVVLKKPVYE